MIPNALSKRVTNPLKLELGDKVECRVMGMATVFEKLRSNIVLQYENGIHETLEAKDMRWANFRYYKPKKTYRIRARTPKRAKQESDYLKRCRNFLSENAYCAVFPSERATQVHHRAGREGGLLLEADHWLPVSQRGHEYIHAHPNEAREQGWLYEAETVWSFSTKRSERKE